MNLKKLFLYSMKFFVNKNFKKKYNKNGTIFEKNTKNNFKKNIFFCLCVIAILVVTIVYVTSPNKEDRSSILNV
jgi:Ni/Fe-hydrogenase subunit HybB-like protein